MKLRNAILAVLLLTLLSIQGIKNADFRETWNKITEETPYEEACEAIEAYNNAWNK